MKKPLLILLLFPTLIISTLRGQTIDGFTTNPTNPTIIDSITIYAHLIFGSGSCNEHTQSYSINGTDIDANAFHCLGMLSFICEHTDTFAIGQLPAGIYNFSFQLNAGQLPSPCTSGIVSGSSGSFTFKVDFPTSINDPGYEDPVFSIYPVPANDGLVIDVSNHLIDNTEFAIYSLDGRKIFSGMLTKPLTTLATTSFSNGVYLAEATGPDSRQRKLFIIQH